MSVCARMSLVSMDAGESVKFPGLTDGVSQLGIEPVTSL